MSSPCLRFLCQISKYNSDKGNTLATFTLQVLKPNYEFYIPFFVSLFTYSFVRGTYPIPVLTRFRTDLMISDSMCFLLLTCSQCIFDKPHVKFHFVKNLTQVTFTCWCKCIIYYHSYQDGVLITLFYLIPTSFPPWIEAVGDVNVIYHKVCCGIVSRNCEI